jgi:hypothetical protein
MIYWNMKKENKTLGQQKKLYACCKCVTRKKSFKLYIKAMGRDGVSCILQRLAIRENG